MLVVKSYFKITGTFENIIENLMGEKIKVDLCHSFPLLKPFSLIQINLAAKSFIL